MSDAIKHECGVAMIRLLKPLDFYVEKYGTSMYGLNKLYLLMQKQHNRGQDGAGVATIKLDSAPGKRYISRARSNETQPLKDIFSKIHGYLENIPKEKFKDAEWMKANVPFMGELLLGHLRYGTHGRNSVENCHPMLRQNNWITRNLVMAGNFNMTNVDELFSKLVKIGQYPKEKSDTITVLEKIGHFLDVEVEQLFQYYKSRGYKSVEINDLIAKHLNIQNILRKSSKKFDGGYTLAGMLGHGDAFVMRDEKGIRPAFYYMDDEVVVVASERPAIQTAFNVHHTEIKEVKPGHALIIKKDGQISQEQCKVPAEVEEKCSFERIYFSRGTDRDIYLERKKLGEILAGKVLKALDYDVENTVFSYVPNTAETAFHGLVDGVNKYIDKYKRKKITSLSEKGELTNKKLKKLLALHPRVEKIIVKDAKLRTFITDDSSRSELVSHVYDVTYGIINNYKDTLVLLDDSIVRGTTLKKSIIKIVSRLKPKKIIIVSSAPQIRYPDCYGIDMSRIQNFVAFKAMEALLKENNKEHLLQEVYELSKAQLDLPMSKMKNYVKKLYAEFTAEEISAKISEIVTPKGIDPKVEVIYQTLDGLHEACPDHSGDWYFSGDYPTPGGVRVVNKAFINYMENNNERAY